MAVEFLLLHPLRTKSGNLRHLMCSMNNNTYEHTKSLLSLFMEFFYHVDTFTERSWEVWWGGGEEAIKITNYIKQNLFGKEQATRYEIWMNCVSPLWSYSSHEIRAASFDAYPKSLHLYTSVTQIQMQFVFNPGKKITCWGNMLCTRIFWFYKQCETHRSPSWWFRTAHWMQRSIFSPLPHICNHLTQQAKGCHHTPPCHRMGFCPVLYHSSIPTARKKTHTNCS